ncbi:MAG: DUF2637 domain-containing protein [Trebonia sp.]
MPVPPAAWQRRLANLLVALAVIAVAAATFVFSYDGVHAIARLGGVSAQLARYYPGLFDAVLVIACVAAIVLRDGRWWARLWAWLVIVVVLAAIGTTDMLHAMNYTLRHRPTEGIVAVAPVVAVLLAFSLLLTMLRQSRARDAQPAAGAAPLDVPALPAALPVFALPAAPAAPATPSDSEGAADSEGPVVADAPEVPGAEVPGAETPHPAHPATQVPEATEAIALEAPVSAGAPAAQDEPAPPTVQVPALTSPPPPGAAARRVPQGIRYAGNGVPGMAGKSAGKPPTAERDASPDADYWESEETGPFAGLVYPARQDNADLDDAAPAEKPAELDDDAPPFATAPFAAVPRLNRVRSMPTPPADEDE